MRSLLMVAGLRAGQGGCGHRGLSAVARKGASTRSVLGGVDCVRDLPHRVQARGDDIAQAPGGAAVRSRPAAQTSALLHTAVGTKIAKPRLKPLQGRVPQGLMFRAKAVLSSGGNASPFLAERNGMIRHIVALRFKADITAQAKAALYTDLAALRDQIPGVLTFHAGPNVSVEPLSRGFDDLFWFDFRDAAVRDAYLIHPAHQAVGARIVAETEGGVEGVFVFDIEVA